MPGTVGTGAGETGVNKTGKNACLRGADMLLSAKRALTSAIFYLMRGIDIGWLLRGPSGLSSDAWRP